MKHFLVTVINQESALAIFRKKKNKTKKHALLQVY